MKHNDSAEHFGEQHLRARELAKMWGVGLSTVYRIIKRKSDPRVVYLPRTPGDGRKRRTPSVPMEVAKEWYVEMIKGAR